MAVNSFRVSNSQITLTTANTVANTKGVYLVNGDASNNALITLKSGDTTIGTFTIVTRDSLILVKAASDTLETTGTNIFATPIVPMN